MKKSYIGIITQRENDLYLVTFPDVPGCSATGSTFEQCYQQGLNALWFALRDIEINYDVDPSTAPVIENYYPYPVESVDHYPMQPNQIPVLFTVEVKGVRQVVVFRNIAEQGEEPVHVQVWPIVE
jgi:predicted RNase H-like HicB family nuclease